MAKKFKSKAKLQVIGTAKVGNQEFSILLGKGQRWSERVEAKVS